MVAVTSPPIGGGNNGALLKVSVGLDIHQFRCAMENVVSLRLSRCAAVRRGGATSAFAEIFLERC